MRTLADTWRMQRFALRNQRWAAAVYQSVLAMEEQGRLLIFYEAYIDGITIDKDMWQIMFGNHKKKIAAVAAAFFIQKQERKWNRTVEKLGSEF